MCKHCTTNYSEEIGVGKSLEAPGLFARPFCPWSTDPHAHLSAVWDNPQEGVSFVLQTEGLGCAFLFRDAFRVAFKGNQRKSAKFWGILTHEIEGSSHQKLVGSYKEDDPRSAHVHVLFWRIPVYTPLTPSVPKPALFQFRRSPATVR